MATPVAGDEADSVAKPGPVLPDTAAPCFPVVPPTKQPTLPERKQGVLRSNVSVLHSLQTFY